MRTKNRTTPARMAGARASRGLARAAAGLALLMGVLTVPHGSGVSAHPAPPSSPPNDVVCFPTCAETDARFLVIAGEDPTTLSGEAVLVTLSTSKVSPNLTFGLFDAERNTTWDRTNGNFATDNAAPFLKLDLFADPNGLGEAAAIGTPVHSWTSCQLSPTTLCVNGEVVWPDNQWMDLTVPNHIAAETTDRYRYMLRISAISPATNRGSNAFKVRTTGTIALAPQSFAFQATFNGAWASVVYPTGNPTAANWNVPTTYDGAWQFAFTLDAGNTHLTVWDGDMDYGNRACTVRDSDDPDTPLLPADVPASEGGFTSISAAPEGVANGLTLAAFCPVALQPATGDPHEDATNVNLFRPPTRLAPAPPINSTAGAGVLYDVTDPNGNSYVNTNPSGNKEWERFKIMVAADANPLQPCLSDSDPDRALADCKAFSLPAGTYTVALDGVDLNNLNFWRFLHKALGFTPSGTPGDEGAFYSLGRYVWFDANEDGIPGSTDPLSTNYEPPIAGVKVTVTDQNGVVQTGFTTKDGEFFFRKPAGTYTVQVDPSNFVGSGVLVDHRSTTGGNIEGGLSLSTEQVYAEAIFGYVLGSNAPPTASPDTLQVTCRTNSVNVLANDSDPEGESLSLVLVASPLHGSASITGPGTITYTALLGFSGQDSFTYTVEDAAGNTSTGKVSVTVTANAPPVAVDDVGPTVAFQTATGPIAVLANDSDGNGGTPTLQSATDGANGSTSVNLLAGTVVYTPNAGFHGSDSFNYTVTDGCSVASARVTVTVEPPPPPPGVCYVGSSNPSVGATQAWVTNADGSITIRTALSQSFNDNTYGVNAITWPGGGRNGGNHRFEHLVTSDMVQLALDDKNGVRRLEFRLDYLSASSQSLTGYQSLGTWGGDGGMVFGDGSMIVSADSSLAVNFRQGVSWPTTITRDSPPLPNANWIYDAWYEVTVRPEAFGVAGFGRPRITAIHASPSKTGVETEPLEDANCTGLVSVPTGGGGYANGTGGKVPGGNGKK